MTDIRQGILATAQALQMDPVDLATIISYETAGTFDPTKRGPTTQWGQHRGLIQFGEPQAKQYGVNWDDPLGSQLGPDGAVANYFRQNGWQPGMGMLDAYSIVNAGGPGLYHRSDANNGGAPGTVADKVNNQMAGHRRKAAALLGGDYSPRTSTGAPAGGPRGPQPSPSRQDGPTNALAPLSTPQNSLTGEQTNALVALLEEQQRKNALVDTRIDPEAFMMETQQAAPVPFDTRNIFEGYV